VGFPLPTICHFTPQACLHYQLQHKARCLIPCNQTKNIFAPQEPTDSWRRHCTQHAGTGLALSSSPGFSQDSRQAKYIQQAGFGLCLACGLRAAPASKREMIKGYIREKGTRRWPHKAVSRETRLRLTYSNAASRSCQNTIRSNTPPK